MFLIIKRIYYLIDILGKKGQFWLQMGTVLELYM